MLESLNWLTDRLTASDGIAAAVTFIISVFVIGLGFGFGAGETLEVLVTGLLLVGIMGIAAGIPWAIGRLVGLLTEDDAP